MFGLNSNKVVHDAIQSADDIIPYLKGSIGKIAPQCMNVILSSFPGNAVTIS